MLYATPAVFSHTLLAPVMAPAALAALPKVTTTELLGLLPHELDGVTDTLPEVVAKSTIIELVPAPLVMDAPAGKVHA